MKISRYFVEIILLSIVACFVISPFMKSDAPPTVIHDTGYYIKYGDEYPVLEDKSRKPPAPIYGFSLDSCYAKSNGWDAFELDTMIKPYISAKDCTIYYNTHKLDVKDKIVIGQPTIINSNKK